MKTVKAAPLDSDKDFSEVTVLEVVEQMPSLMLAIKGASCFPPLAVFNDLLSNGKIDDGMSGGIFWEAFVLSLDDYEDLKKSLSIKYDIAFKSNDKLDCLNKYKDWQNKSLKYCRSAR